MEIKQLLSEQRKIWGDRKLTLSQITVRMGKVFGDICRWARNEKTTDRAGGETELKKELGNMIASTIRWCDDLGYDPEECVNIALEAQKEYQKDVQKNNVS
jgi:hypothetical protein